MLFRLAITARNSGCVIYWKTYLIRSHPVRHKLVKVKNIISLSSAFQESKDSSVAVPRMGLIYGFTGIGKTTATAWLVNKENGIYI